VGEYSQGIPGCVFTTTHRQSHQLKRREVHLWKLDFDRATEIEMTEGDVNKKLWDEFCSAYLKASKIILRAKGVDKKVITLPRQFPDNVVE
jgi:hypothetical protein